MTIGSVRPPRAAIEVSGSDAVSGEPVRAQAGRGVTRAPRSFDRRQRIVLSCALCSGRNYRTTKARTEGALPLQLKKFCSTCNAHTQHREAV